MPSQEAIVGCYTHLTHFYKHREALYMLQSVIDMVEPIMRRHSWKIQRLSEIDPTKSPGLLGLNRQKTEIFLTLRAWQNCNYFRPMQEIVDTMLHELSHMVHWEHDQNFQNLWAYLRYECMLLPGGFDIRGNLILQGYRIGGTTLGCHVVHEEESIIAGQAAEEKRLAKDANRLAQQAAERTRLAKEAAEKRRNFQEAAAKARLVNKGAKKSRLEKEAAERRRLAREAAEKRRIQAERETKTAKVPKAPKPTETVKVTGGTTSADAFKTSPKTVTVADGTKQGDPAKPTATIDVKAVDVLKTSKAVKTAPDRTRIVEVVVTKAVKPVNTKLKHHRGTAPDRGRSLQAVLARSVKRGNKIPCTCGTANLSEAEINEIADETRQDSVTTGVDEVGVDEFAIAKALAELEQLDTSSLSGEVRGPGSEAESSGGGANSSSAVAGTKPVKTWECLVCTLHNPLQFFCCDACGTKRREKCHGEELAS